MLHQQAARDHPHPVVHPPGLPELPHPRIDNGIAGAPLLPGAQQVSVPSPGEGVEFRAQVARRHLRPVPEQVIGEFAPEDLLQEGLDPRPPRRRAGRVPDLPGRDLAPAQMRRQARGPLDPRQVALGVIGHERPGGEAGEPCGGAGFPRLPQRIEACGPIGLARCGMQAEILQALAARGQRGAGDGGGGGQARGRIAGGQQRLGEGCVDRIRLAAAGGDAMRFAQQHGGVQMQLAARGFQGFVHAAALGAGPWLDGPAGMHLSGTGGYRQGRDHRLCPAARQQQRRAARREVGAERGKAPLQPPARGAARRVVARRLRVPDEDGQNARTGGQRGVERRVVSQAQIVAEPDQDGRGHGPHVGRPRDCGSLRRHPLISVGGGASRFVAPRSGPVGKLNSRPSPSRKARPPRGNSAAMAGAVMSSPPV